MSDEPESPPSRGLPVPGPGRPCGYKVEMNEQARKLCLLGFTDAELANFFGICVETLNPWKSQFPAFSASISSGKEPADAEVADSFYRRATGETIEVEQVIREGDDYRKITLKKYIPGDAQAAHRWLLNRRRKDWSEKKTLELTGPDGGPIQTEDVNARDLLASRVASLAERSGSSSGDGGAV